MNLLSFVLLLLSFQLVLGFSEGFPVIKNQDRINRALGVGKKSQTNLKASESASICVIGGGVSGLTAALTAAKESKGNDVVILESSETVGGRVQSDRDENGFVLDRGFAVFIEEYPFSKQLLDYDALKLGKFLPGALVKVRDSNALARVADPLRVPQDLLVALLAPVGSLFDKIAVLPLIFNVRTKSIEELFEEPETDTLFALKNRWGFSNDMIDKFFKPFLEGIYLAPLEEQSSRMFSFVFKMFSEGAATLPAGGMGAVSDQLLSKATEAGVSVRLGQAVGGISKTDNGFIIKSSEGKVIMEAKTVVLAADGEISKQILSTVEGLENLKSKENQVQRSVGCLYYTFEGRPPVEDPILILNGIGAERGNEKNPVNNICFPSVVRSSYAPQGSSICSVTVLKPAMDMYKGRDDDLDAAVRNQLGTWFPERKSEILNKWKLSRIYKIPKAQPAQLNGPTPANVNKGRSCNMFCGEKLPDGLFVCGDHVATATLNGALESGVNAGKAAAKTLQL